MSKPTKPYALPDKDLHRISASGRLSDTDLERLKVAHHEVGHAVAAVLFGGRVHKAVLGDTPRTEYDATPDGSDASIAYAGPWSEARWLVGRHPGPRDIHRVLAGTSDDKTLCAAGGPTAAPGVVALLERCWPAIGAVAKQLFLDGQVGHSDVCAALGLSDEGGAGSFELANIRAGLRAVS